MDDPSNVIMLLRCCFFFLLKWGYSLLAPIIIWITSVIDCLPNDFDLLALAPVERILSTCPFRCELDLILKLLTILCGMAIVFMEGTVSCFVHIGTISDRIGPPEIRLVRNSV